MSKKPLVSIITPCYNGEKFIHRYFESILSQTYDRMEVIFVNDGSDDKTEEIALSYGEKLKRKGIEFQYIYQENTGQAAALNKGLEILKGDYFTWPDSDDWMMPECIRKKVDFLEEHKEFGLVRSDAALYSEEDDTKPLFLVASKRDKASRHIFLDLLTEQTYCCSGCYMARTISFRHVNPDMRILPVKSGQNWQMEIPLSYHYPCGYIDEPLYCILVRKDSHSREKKRLEEEKKRNNEIKQIRLWCVEQACPEKEDLRHRIERMYLEKQMELGYLYQNRTMVIENYKKLKETYGVDCKTKLLYYRGRYKGFDIVLKAGNLPMRMFRKLNYLLKQKNK